MSASFVSSETEDSDVGRSSGAVEESEELLPEDLMLEELFAEETVELSQSGFGRKGQRS